MTSSKAGLLALLLGLQWVPAWAALGEQQSSVQADSVRLQARRSVAAMARYTVHDLQMPDGSLVQQFVSGSGQVFAVRWNTLYKPDLSSLLGTSFAGYAAATQQAGQRGGIQRHFRHTGMDVVVQTSAHLHVYTGFAYRPSMLPQGVSAQVLGGG